MERYANVFMIAIVLVLIVYVLVFLRKRHFARKDVETVAKKGKGTCSASTCGAIDDVNSPKYNIKESIKNALLIEDHLANKRKYCKSCLCKHFLYQSAILEEAVWMACKNCKDYPKLEESVKLFNDVFEQWHKKMDDDDTRTDVLAKIRQWRQDMINLYFFNDKTNLLI
jgi:hypothetical protein